MPEKISIKKHFVFFDFVCNVGSTCDRASQLFTPPDVARLISDEPHGDESCSKIQQLSTQNIPRILCNGTFPLTHSQKSPFNLYLISVVGSKVKVKVKITLEQATKAQRGSRGIALLFL